MSGERKFAPPLAYTNDWAAHAPDRFKVCIILASGDSEDAIPEIQNMAVSVVGVGEEEFSEGLSGSVDYVNFDDCSANNYGMITDEVLREVPGKMVKYFLR